MDNQQQRPHRLPQRKRPRPPEHETGGDTAPACAAPPPPPPPPPTTGPGSHTAVSLDLIAELVMNGTMAPHFASLYELTHEPSWLPRAAVEVEVEVGGTVATIAAPPPTNDDAATTTAAAAGASTAATPLLFRAFQRRRLQDSLGATPRPFGGNHCLTTGTYPLDDWVPPNVLHAVKALGLCGVAFVGPQVVFQSSSMVVMAVPSAQGPPRRTHVARRVQATLRPGIDPAGHG